MRFRPVLHPASGFLLTLFCACLALAQATNGSIRGTVKDQAGAVLPKATVAIKHLDTNTERKEVTREDGTYVADNLPPGEYEVTVEAPHFQKQLQRITVLTGGNVEADFSMTVGASSETVVVTSEAGQINTSDYKVDGVITRERIENLPLNGRSFLSLASLEPGVSAEYSSNPGTSVNNYFRVSIAGASQIFTRISVDGANVNDRITGGTSQNFSQETVQEFQLSTFNFDLSTGNTSAGAVNIVSRTGSNAFHGSGFYFFRDHNIAAYPGFRRPCDPSVGTLNPLCNDPAARPRLENPVFVRRNTGVNLGGPLKKDRLFFFSNFEYTNQVGAPTVSFTNSIFSGFSHVGQQPFRGKLFNTRLDYKVSNKHNAFLRYSEDSNRNISSSGNLESNWTSSRNFAYQINGGLTSILRSNLVNEARYSYSFLSNQLRPPDATECTIPLYCFNLNGPRISAGPLVFGNQVNVTQHRLLRTYQLTDNVYWQKGTHRVRFGGNWEHFYGHGSWARIFQGQFSLFSPETLATQSPALYALLPATLRTTTAGLPSFADILKLPVSGSLSLGVGDAKQPPAYRGEEAARNNSYRLYVQDSWQLRPKFTFSYGLAWSFENNLVSHDLDKPEYLRPVLGGAKADLRPTRQDWNNFDPSMGFAWTLGKQSKTVIRGGTGIYHNSTNLIYTRLGERGLIGPAGNGLVTLATTAYQNPLFGTNPGAGATPPQFLNFTAPTLFTGQDMLNLIPTVRTAFQSLAGNGQDLSIRGIEVIKQAPSAAAAEGVFTSDVTTGYTYQVTAGVQRELARNLVLTADFVMRRGVHFGGYDSTMGVDTNHFDQRKVTAVNPTTGAVTSVNDPVLPICTAAQANTAKFPCSTGRIVIFWSGVNSRYLGLLVKLNKRFANSFQLTGSYALSRYTTNINLGSLGTPNLDPYDFYASAGINGSDRTHRFTFSGIWELPTYKGEQRFLRGALNGWQVSMISEMVSAPPLNPIVGVDIVGHGVSIFPLPGIEWNGFGRGASADDIRKAVDQFNATYPKGAVTDTNRLRTSKNEVIPIIKLPDQFSNGDPFFSQDIRLTRVVKIREKVKLSLIGEVFNVFNIANLTGYSGTLNALVAPGQVQQATFGQPGDRVNQIFGTGGPRAFQFAARISF